MSGSHEKKIKIIRTLPAHLFPPAIRGVRIPKKFRAPLRGTVVKAIFSTDGSCSVRIIDLLNNRPNNCRLRNWWVKNLLARDIIGVRIYPPTNLYQELAD